MANAETFLRVPESTLSSEAFFHCPPHGNGRRLRSGDKNTVRDGSRLWSSAQYSFNDLRRFRYYSCQRSGDIDDYLKFVRSYHRLSRPKIQQQLQQVSGYKYPFPRRFREILQLDHILSCSTNCKLLYRILKTISYQYDRRSGWGFLFGLLPYGDAWRAMFTKHFNPSNRSINQPREIIYVRRFLGQLLQNPNDFLQHVRTYVSIYYISSFW